MKRLGNTLCVLTCAIALTAFLAGCGGGGGSSGAADNGSGSSGGSDDSAGDGSTETVTGIATPSSVSVVTATNAD